MEEPLLILRAPSQRRDIPHADDLLLFADGALSPGGIEGNFPNLAAKRGVASELSARSRLTEDYLAIPTARCDYFGVR